MSISRATKLPGAVPALRHLGGPLLQRSHRQEPLDGRPGHAQHQEHAGQDSGQVYFIIYQYPLQKPTEGQCPYLFIAYLKEDFFLKKD